MQSRRNKCKTMAESRAFFNLTSRAEEEEKMLLGDNAKKCTQKAKAFPTKKERVKNRPFFRAAHCACAYTVVRRNQCAED